MPRQYRLYVEDLLEAIEKIQSYAKGLSYDTFSENKLVVDAVIRNLEVIGEAVKKFPPEIKRRHPEIEWKKIAGLRDILIHEYFGVDLRILMDIVVNKIPELKSAMKKILEELE